MTRATALQNVRSTAIRAGLAMLACLPFSAPASQAVEIDLQPTSVEMIAEPGTRQRQVLTITNEDPLAPVEMTIGLADWTLSREGDIQLSAPGLDVQAASDWVRFSPSFVTLQPGQSQNVIVDIITPARLPHLGSYRFALLASAILPDNRPGRAGMLRKHETVSLFYMTAYPAHSDPTVRDARLTRQPDGSEAISLMVENSGNAHARLEGSVRVSGKGAPVDIPVSNLVVLDSGIRQFLVPVSETLPDDPKVTISFENIFAPQVEGLALPVKTYSAPLNPPRSD